MNLTLFFTEGVALHTWHQNGMLARELALYKRLHSQGISVKFVTYGNRSDHRLTKELHGIELLTNDLNLPLEWYQRKLELWPPTGDIFKSNQVAGADVALAAARRRRAKFVARCGYLLSEFQERKYGAGSAEGQAALELEKRVFGEADKAVVTTVAMANYVRDNYGVDATSIRVIPNYVETDRFKPGKGNGTSRFRVGFVGRLDVQKNVFALLEAVRDLDLELHLAGYGPQRAQLEEKSKGSKANIVFRGSIPNAELPAFLASSDMFVLPSLYEGHPKALIEAMSTGLPVIGTRVPGVENLLQHGETGYLAQTDADSLREAISTLIADAALRQKLGQAARQFVEKNFSLEHVLKLEVDMLSNLNA
jgi:glycosyltransferase involved in cell wall biosynthesis